MQQGHAQFLEFLRFPGINRLNFRLQNCHYMGFLFPLLHRFFYFHAAIVEKQLYHAGVSHTSVFPKTV